MRVLRPYFKTHNIVVLQPIEQGSKLTLDFMFATKEELPEGVEPITGDYVEAFKGNCNCVASHESLPDRLRVNFEDKTLDDRFANGATSIVITKTMGVAFKDGTNTWIQNSKGNFVFDPNKEQTTISFEALVIKKGHYVAPTAAPAAAPESAPSE